VRIRAKSKALVLNDPIHGSIILIGCGRTMIVPFSRSMYRGIGRLKILLLFCKGDDILLLVFDTSFGGPTIFRRRAKSRRAPFFVLNIVICHTHEKKRLARIIAL